MTLASGLVKTGGFHAQTHQAPGDSMPIVPLDTQLVISIRASIAAPEVP